MGCASSVPATADAPTKPSLAKMDQLTSDAYSKAHPPTHWSDAVLLVPHEWLRHEMNAMLVSVQALPDSPTRAEYWKTLNFAKWLAGFFSSVVHLHHDNEEKIYFPFLKKHGGQIPESQLAKDHQALMDELAVLKDLAKEIIQGEGVKCDEAIADLKAKVPVFVKDMKEHLKEEERTLPAIIQSYVTREQNHSCVQEILRLGGMDGLHTELPGVMVATKHWATPTYYEQFLQEVSPALAQLAQDVFIPNYMNIHCAFRDSPTRNLPPVVDEIPLDPSRLPRPAPEAPLSSK